MLLIFLTVDVVTLSDIHCSIVCSVLHYIFHVGICYVLWKLLSKNVNENEYSPDANRPFSQEFMFSAFQNDLPMSTGFLLLWVSPNHYACR